jgi:GNAT superfamily N-acetyltransferase
MLIPDGYNDVAPGKLASVVTCLEMLAAVPARAERADAPWQIRPVPGPDLNWYRDLYGRVGADWLWFSRLAMSREKLAGILYDPLVEVYAMSIGGRDEGLLELDFRDAGQCELAFYGLTSALIGQGAGRALMSFAIEKAWARPIRRFWVHTCTLDHHAALGFYQRSGFKPYARRVEVADDPRVTGVVPRSFAPHLPIIDPGA